LIPSTIFIARPLREAPGIKRGLLFTPSFPVVTDDLDIVSKQRQSIFSKNKLYSSPFQGKFSN
jgi:hypothetical protein